MKRIAYVGSFFVLLVVFSYFLSKGNNLYADTNTDFECNLIEKTKCVINEDNYFQTNSSGAFFTNHDICYDIYSDGTDYFVVLTSEDNAAYAFTKYEDNFYYLGKDNGEYNKTPKICNGNFYIDGVHKPDYTANSNARVTRFLDSETILSSVISNYGYDEFYTVYLLDSFPWDKSDYLNGSELIDIMIIDKNKNVFVTYCYFSANGWNVGTPGFRFHQDEYPELVQKYKDISVCSKSAVNNIFNYDE